MCRSVQTSQACDLFLTHLGQDERGSVEAETAGLCKHVSLPFEALYHGR